MDIYSRVLRVVYWVLVVLVVTVLAAGMLIAKVRAQDTDPPKLPLPVQGKWLMLWNSGRWDTEFYQGGGYVAKDSNTTWYGSWEVKGAVLHVEEFVDPGPSGKVGSILRWDVQIAPGTRKGVLSGGGDFSLDKP